MTTEKITSAALALPPDSRVELAETLIHSLNPKQGRALHKAWEKEISRRIAAFERGEINLIPEEEVNRKIRKRKRT
jgi:putative addiction module component (TIGR02574 family)